MKGSLRGRLPSHHDDRGAALVEFAFVLSLLILMFVGIMEFSLGFKDKAAVSSSVRVGARIASTGAGAGVALCGTPPTQAPCSPTRPALAQAAADAIRVAGVAMPKDSIDWIMVYRVLPGESGEPPATSNPAANCTTNCVWFKWVDADDRFSFQGGSWNQSTINACLNSGLAQSVGVFMQVTHTNVTGFFGRTFTLKDRAVMKFEPLPALSCNGLGPANGGHQ